VFQDRTIKEISKM